MNHYKIKKQIAIDTNIQIYLLNITENIGNINLKFIPQVQINEISQYKIKLDCTKRLLARSFLYEFLNKHYGATNFELDFNEYQKPFLNGVLNIQFSFSYAKDYIAVGVSKDKKIGIDIEYMDPTLKTSQIASEIMSKAELDRFNLYSENSLSQRIFFYKLFSAKESIIKSFGTGLYFNVKNINTFENNQYIYEQTHFIHIGLGFWMDKYTLSICYEK